MSDIAKFLEDASGAFRAGHADGLDLAAQQIVENLGLVEDDELPQQLGLSHPSVSTFGMKLDRLADTIDAHLQHKEAKAVGFDEMRLAKLAIAVAGRVLSPQ